MVEQVEQQHGQRGIVLTACMLATFMAAVEVTIVSTAMPTIIGDLGGFSLLGWVFAAYLLTQAISIPIYGRLADLYGRKSMFYIGASLFLLGSVLCGFANNMLWMIIFRAIQGMGAGAITPIAFTIVADIYSPAERPKIQGYLSSVWGVSAIVGPLMGAFIVQHFNWALVFWVNVPIGLTAMYLLWRYFP
ncbi:MAG: MFS transporter, partial [Hafnia sp.]